MSERPGTRPGAPYARPLGFTLLMLYGLLTFLTGYQDWQGAGRLAPWADWLLIICGVLLGSAAIRVILRRRRAFAQTLLATAALLIADLVTTLLPGTAETWYQPLARALLSAVILGCVRRADAALPPAPAVGEPSAEEID
jgi:hypothetical protein